MNEKIKSKQGYAAANTTNNAIWLLKIIEDIVVNFEKWMCEFCKKEFDWICVNNIVITGGPSSQIWRGTIREGCSDCINALPDPKPTQKWLDHHGKKAEEFL